MADDNTASSRDDLLCFAHEFKSVKVNLLRQKELRASLVTFMCTSSAGHRRPWLVPSQSYPTIDAYILDKNIATTGCMSDIEVQFIASLQHIRICIFTTASGRKEQRKWIFYSPALIMQECMAGTRDYHLHLYQNTAKYHLDWVVFNAHWLQHLYCTALLK